MKKKLLSMLLVGAMVLSLAACGGSGESSDSGSDDAGTEDAAAEDAGAEDAAAEESGGGEGKEFNIIYLSPSTASDFWSYVGVGINNAYKDLEESEGIKVNYEVVGPAEESQTEEYVSAFEKTIAKKPDAIVTATLAMDATIPKAQEATNAGIVLNFVNCGIGTGDDGANEDAYNEFYYCSNDSIGELAAQAFKEAAQAKGITSGTVGVNMNVENEALNHRIDAFRTGMEDTDFELTDTYYNGNVVENSQSNAENIISTFGDKLVGMYSGNNITGDGVCNAVAAAGIGDKIVSIAVDSDPTEIDALRNGNLDALILQDAYQQGYLCMENAIKTLLNGSNPESKKQINCPPSIVTLDNIDTDESKQLLDPTFMEK